MKIIKLIVCVGVFMLGIHLQSIAQVELPEIEVRAMNYKYLNAVDTEDTPQPVSLLERYTASYDIVESEFYEDEYDQYFISFYIPEGKILAVYDGEGNLKRTAERFKNVQVPQAVREAVAEKYPNWVITRDVYLVTYHQEKGTEKKYKLVLENGDSRIRVKITDKGEFL